MQGEYKYPTTKVRGFTATQSIYRGKRYEKIRLYTFRGIINVYVGYMAIESFKTRVIDSNRITIPEEYVASLKVKKGDIVKVTIETVR